MDHKRLFRFVFAVTLPFLFACVKKSRVTELPYQTFSARFGIKDAIELKLVEDGGTIEFYAADAETEKPLFGLTVLIGEGKEKKTLKADSAGRISIPASLQLIEENPKVRLIKPKGTKEASLSLALSINCHEIGKPASAVNVSEDGWVTVQAGPDRVYAEKSFPEEKVKKAVLLLEEERRALTEILGEEPAPVALALLGDAHGNIRSFNDKDGRVIWPLHEREVDDDNAIIGTVVHEWTHIILEKNFGFEGDEGTRYLEDGFCDLMAHLVHLRLRGGAVSTTVAGRLEELKESKAKKEPEADLLLLSVANDVSSFDSVLGVISAACGDIDNAVFGYDLGLAFWLDHLDKTPNLVAEFLAHLKSTGDSSARALYNLFPKLSPDGFEMRAINVEAALLVLQRHAGGSQTGEP